MLLPVDHEVLYDTFTARWPRGLDRERARGGSLRLTASPLPDAPGALRSRARRASADRVSDVLATSSADEVVTWLLGPAHLDVL
ncbi:MAG: hypothetical protein R3B82_20395 [Sandaracinaceae bacterium]